ncbi:MAG TPA: chromosomal replication initiator protein DnaA [Burkholderiaceae bacterium]|nr:chromosomal replication initiator protein DnaA [Burkholderiaceae bacterium]
MNDLWQDCSRLLESELSPQQYSAWIKPLRPIDFDDATGSLRIGAPNRLKLDAIRAQFLNRIQAVATTVAQRPIQVIFEVQSLEPAQATAPGTGGHGDPASPPQASEPVRSAFAVDAPMPSLPTPPSSNLPPPIARGPTTLGGALSGLAGRIGPGPATLPGAASPHAPAVVLGARTETIERARLNPMLTFDSFVTGNANQLARAAAMQVADNPGGSYNPLFLYGGVGLGKTHLIHAVGNSLLAHRPSAKVRYIHAEQYVSDVVRAYQRKAFDDFKRYYHSLDLLLIDDIQFFAGKSRTQEEFFYAFEALVAGRKQIIISSDTYPKELKDIEDRLVSRFSSGLTVAIEPPELEMRVAILLKKAELEGAELAEDVAFFIAKNLRSNVRELEGALRKVLAFASFHNRPVTVELARESLRDLLSAVTAQITVELIQKTVAEYYKIKVADMYSKRRPQNIALPRQVAMYLSKELTQKSLPEIGDLFGGRDHTTVLHAVRKIQEHRAKDTNLSYTLHVLEQTLKG